MKYLGLGLLGYKFFFWKIYKTVRPPSYILNVRSLKKLSVSIWKEISSHMFKQNGDLKVLVSFLSLENDTESACLKLTFTLCNVVWISWFILKRTYFFIWLEIFQLCPFSWGRTLKFKMGVLSLVDDKEHIRNKPTLSRLLSYITLSE